MIDEIINNQLIQLLALFLSMFPLAVGFNKLIRLFIRHIRIHKDKKENEIRKHFYSLLNSTEFQNWRDKVLLEIYGENYFTKVFNISFPAFVIEFEKYFQYSEFKELYDKDDLSFEGVPLKELRHKEINVPDIHNTLIVKSGSPKEIKEKKKLILEYKKILGDSVKYPKLIGFMLDHYKLNNKRIAHIYPKLGDYALNLFSSHILEYELLRAFEKVGNKNFKEYNLWDYLPFRKYIHQPNSENYNIENILYSGERRYSLFSVQCFVMFKDKDKNKYTTILMKRATDPTKVAAKVGFYQFPPAGGFELYEKEEIHTGDTIIENYSLRKAIFREYLEEIFGIDDFKAVNSTTNQETTNNILYHNEVQLIMSMIEQGSATFELLGVAVDLVGLRHELSFILKIDDETYSSTKHFCPNDEFTRDQSVASKIRIPVSDLEKLLHNRQNINQGSALLYHMAKKWCKQKNINI